MAKATVPRPAASRGRFLAGARTPGLSGRNSLDHMLVALTIAVSVAALALAAWCGHAAYRDQPTKDWHFIGMAVVTVLALVQLVVGIVQLARGEEPADGSVIFVSYLIGAFAAVPAAGFLSLAERTRWGSATVSAGAVVLAVLEVRLYDIWGG
ncbi:hypothetical protein GCM10011583_44380 [Streptomyces camponoticapitis]|uniref:Integral membrane protein n=2 Tax=Streptomyces camponoticapitis TaxID=1616125 RepID=A0ABQ2EE17_9ACTN|nr:hypothetical protein GCM10011583_44380 [Streptomyces camponoticapitis]